MFIRLLISAILAFESSFLFALEEADAAQNQASSLFERAGEAIARKDYKKAKVYLDQAIALDPKNGRFYVVRGHVLSWLNNRGCLDDFNQAIKVYPLESELYAARAEREYVYKHSAAALKDIARAIELEPKNPEYHLFRSVFVQAQNRDEAIKEAKIAVSLSPNEHKYHSHLITVREGTATDTELLSEENRILESAPNCAKCLMRRAQINIALSSLEAAAKDAEKAYRLEKSRDTCLVYGLVLSQSGKFAQAETIYSEALKLSPDDTTALRCLANVKITQKRPEEAIHDLNRVIALSPTDAQSYKLRGDCYFLLGQKANSDKDHAKAYKLSPALDKATVGGKAKAYESQQNYTAALQEYNKLLASNGSGLVYLQRAECQEKTGNLDAAAKDYKKAYQLAPKLELKARRARAKVLVRIRNFREALVEYDRLIEMYPRNNQLVYTRADIYESLGDKARAQKERGRADEMLDKVLQEKGH